MAASPSPNYCFLGAMLQPSALGHLPLRAILRMSDFHTLQKLPVR
jgi:hypothetical protein